MKLWRVYNGWCGFGDTHCIVLAKNKEEARIVAVKRFKEDGEQYGERYYNNLTFELLTNDITKPYASKISD